MNKLFYFMYFLYFLYEPFKLIFSITYHVLALSLLCNVFHQSNMIRKILKAVLLRYEQISFSDHFRIYKMA